LVKRLLKKYKYPPEEAEDAMNVVLKQCEQWSENNDSSDVPVTINVTIENHYHGNIDNLTINE
jgi:type I restriction enzyme R subunit